MKKATPKSASSGFGVGKLEPEPTPPVSESSAAPSSESSKPVPVKIWEIPRDMAEFTAQANEVAVGILNEEVNIDKGRVYASIIRVVSQAFATQVAVARMTRSAAPTLSLAPKEK